MTCEQSTLNHQSQMKYCCWKRVPLGQRKLYLEQLKIETIQKITNTDLIMMTNIITIIKTYLLSPP